ncbi:MAG: magnesium transporter, partial [Planctomycetota bacterium]
MSDETQNDLRERLERASEEHDGAAAESVLDSVSSADAIRAVSQMSEEGRAALLASLPTERAAALVEQIPDAQAVEIFDDLAPDAAARIITELPSAEQADLLGDLSREDAEAILASMSPEDAREARVLTRYADDVAGGLMVTELLAYPEDFTVEQVVSDLRANAETYQDYDVQYAYVVDRRHRLRGVLPMRKLLLAPPSQPIRELMVRNPVSVRDDASLDELRELFDKHRFFGVPVVDRRGALLGVIQRAGVEEALAERTDDEYRKALGIVGGEELRSMPLLVRSRRRLAWLSVNIMLNIIAASVIALYQDTLSAVIALAVFLPIISDMSGCSGNQAVAVSMRELSLGLVRPGDVFRVWLKEVAVGLVNGVVLGGLIAAAAWLWKGNAWLGLVVGAALALNTLISVSIGGTVPLL